MNAWRKLHHQWLFESPEVAELDDEAQATLVLLATVGVDEWGRAPLSDRLLAARLQGQGAVARIRRLAAVAPRLVRVYEAEGREWVVVRPLSAVILEHEGALA